MTIFRTLAIFILAASSMVSADEDPRDTYIDLVSGSFSSAAQANRDNRYDKVIWHLAEVRPDDPSGARWLYVEQWEDGAAAPYRQRLQRYTLTPEGGIAVRAFRLPEPALYVGAWKLPGMFAGFNIDTLAAAQGCDVVLARTGERRFEGATNGQLCQTSWQGASYAVSHSLVTHEKMVNWDRGFTSEGQRVWGPVSGGYEFRRLGDNTVCADPVYMVVYGTISDRGRFGAYARAIGQSGLYQKNKGYYAAITPVEAVFEGTPGDSHGMVLAHFPCLKAAQDFWYSKEYEAIKPLREGIADFTVTVVKARPAPDYIRE